jgi:NRPS condensation-like uncharacterized protein
MTRSNNQNRHSSVRSFIQSRPSPRLRRIYENNRSVLLNYVNNNNFNINDIILNEILFLLMKY